MECNVLQLRSSKMYCTLYTPVCDCKSISGILTPCGLWLVEHNLHSRVYWCLFLQFFYDLLSNLG